MFFYGISWFMFWYTNDTDTGVKCCVCLWSQGERGPPGPPGIQGETGIGLSGPKVSHVVDRPVNTLLYFVNICDCLVGI